ncbi:hypothetical protein BDR22DRAFT_964395 [Usnea florida]
MPGIITTYTEFADAHVARYEKRGKARKISRAKVEYQILQVINEADLLIDAKLSWTHAILISQLFDALWESISRRLNLPKSCTARYVPDPTLVQFEAPSDDEEDGIVDRVKAENEISDTEPAPPTKDSESRQSSPDIPSSDSGSATPPSLLQRAANMPTPAQRRARILAEAAAQPRCEYCGVRGHDASDCFSKIQWGAKEVVTEANTPGSPEPAKDPATTVRDEDSRATLDGSDITSHEARDNSYEESSHQTKGSVKTKTSTKAASKPQGVKKNKTAAKKKTPIPAQLKTAAAKHLEAVQSNAAEPSSAAPAPTTTTPARPSNPTTTTNNNPPAQTSPAAPHPTTNTPARPSNPVHPSPAAPPLATTATTNPAATRSARPPDAMDRTLARIQERMAPAYEGILKRLRDVVPADEDEEGPESKKVKTGGDGDAAAVGDGKRKKGDKSKKS